MTTGIREEQESGIEYAPEAWDFHFQEIRFVGEVSDIPNELHYFNEYSKPALRVKVKVWSYNHAAKRYNYDHLRITLKGESAQWALRYIKVGDQISGLGRLRISKVKSNCNDFECHNYQTDIIAFTFKKLNGTQEEESWKNERR